MRILVHLPSADARGFRAQHFARPARPPRAAHRGADHPREHPHLALTTCPDCSNQYAADAPYCPNCGRPNPARQTGAAGAAPGGTMGATGSPPSETPAGTGSTSSTYTAGSTGSAGQGGYTGGANQAPGGTGGYTAGPAGGPGAGGGYAGGGGYGGGGAGGYGGGPVGGGSPPQPIPNYLVHAILVTLCCCLPFGIVSIIYATQVNSKRDMGDIAGAMEASNNAKKWAMIGAGVGVVWLIIVIAFNGLAFLAALAGGGTTG